MLHSRGFTLIELLVVISIISLLASVVLASISSARDKANIAAGKEFDASTYHAIGDSLVAEWDFDNNILDSSGNGYVSTINGPANYNTGVFNQALIFNTNTSTYLSVPDNPALAPANITVGAWVNSNNTANEQIIANKYSNATIGWDMEIYQSKLWFSVNNNAGLSGQTVLKSNTWYYVAASYDGSTIKLYVNGKLDGTFATANGISNPTGTPFWIGRYTVGGGWYFDGIIDELRIYSRSL